MMLTEAAGLVADDLKRRGYVESNGHVLTPWDFIFFGKPAPKATKEKPCECGGIMKFRHTHEYITGDWHCQKCTRIYSASIAETIGGLM